ncbi:hypothetical protein Acr_08g0012380 [Actinidia rufa]|uniref:Uncharacterized protein n=1 Tax=Actinidia rufa TaxID=165716 RepID=A0A7J0F2C6_9ERIC|nr:hypothetical protein Acr_08g0012380 [Actinidia rufa]
MTSSPSLSTIASPSSKHHGTTLPTIAISINSMHKFTKYPSLGHIDGLGLSITLLYCKPGARRRPWRDCLPPPSHHPWPIGAPARPVEGHRAKRKPFEVKSTLIGVESSLVRSVSKQISHSHSPRRRLTIGSAFPTRSGRVSDEIGASFRQASEKEAPIRGSQGDSPPLCKIPATKLFTPYKHHLP